MKSTDALHQRPASEPGSPSLDGVRSVLHRGIGEHLPSQLKNLRAHRYQGQDQDMLLSMLSLTDQAHARLLYDYAKGVHLCWLSMRDAPDWGVLREKVLALLAPPLRSAAKGLGLETMAQTSDSDVKHAIGKVLHDLRGGALMSLQLYAHMAQMDGNPADLRAAAYLTRDQAKIMRNALPDLDPEVRQADEAEKPHFMQTVLEKWDGFRFGGADGQMGRVEVSCAYHGLLASCCLEASAVDRVIYNYVNNATRFSSGPIIRMDIQPVDEQTVRWIVANPITRDQERWLQHETNGDLSRLFRGGLTRDGNGLGLSNCADFVAAAFGLPDIESALRGRYLGAKVEDGWYWAWAHWPALYPRDSTRHAATPGEASPG
ncbi:hypothetical protein [Hydrogenophaga sp.]|uniref:hypothetical protein n=1 Tax=Hydrogenophaga sp. TaxID=1904254 RepID=UPI00391D3241